MLPAAAQLERMMRLTCSKHSAVQVAMRIGKEETEDTGETEVSRAGGKMNSEEVEEQEGMMGAPRKRKKIEEREGKGRKGVRNDDGTGDQSRCVFQSVVT